MKRCVQRPETTSSLARTYGTNTHFFFVHRQRQLRRTRFFPRWVKTIGEVPGSNASDMQQCGNSEAIRSEISSCDGSLLCKVTIKSFAGTILYVCCCYYVWLFDGLSTCANHEPQQWDSSSVHRILPQSNPHTTIHNTTERNYCNASISAKLAARTKNT